ncbi:MAG: TrwC relaxase, partial [Propioniciclava sp.]
MEHDRITSGDEEAMIDAAYTAWRRDLAEGRDSILIAETNATVTEMNARARADRIIDGAVAPTREVALHDGTADSTGDLVITRENDRRLRNGRTWVRNGARWIVTDVRADGSVSIR